MHTQGSFGDYSHALNDRVGILLEVVEPKPMETRMVILKAEEINDDLAKDGRAIFYGILFDFDKATIKDESTSQLQQIAKALQDKPNLKVYIVGHSDNVGQLSYNLSLSQQRAQAVAQALITGYHINPNRIIAKGLGPFAPIATNRTDEGRSKNRRVEMVEIATT